MVKVQPDGDEDYRLLSFEEFLKLTNETIGPQYGSRISEALNSYGVFWLLDRERLRLERLGPMSEQIINRQKELNIQAKARAQKDKESINPAENLAGVVPTIPALEAIPNPLDISVKSPSTNTSPSLPFARR